MKIINRAKEPVEACCQFEYKGMIISMSTILNKNRVDIAVLDDSSPFSSSKDKYGFYSVEEAIKYIKKVTK